MAANLISLCLLAALLTPQVAPLRPFSMPRRLFLPVESDPSIDEGVQRISMRERRESLDTSDVSELPNFVDSYKHRSRRSTDQDVDQVDESLIDMRSFQIPNNHDTLYVHWSGSKKAGSETIVALTKDQSSEPSTNSSEVFVTHDYGKKEWLKLPLGSCNGKQTIVDQFYTSKADHKLYIFTDIVNNCMLVSVDDANSIGTTLALKWQPSFLNPHPTDSNYIFGYDKNNKGTLYLSKNKGGTWKEVKTNVKSFYWGVPKYTKFGGEVIDLDDEKTIYVEYIPEGKNLSTVLKYSDYNLDSPEEILTDVEDFVVVENFLLATRDKNGGRDADFLINHNRTMANGKLQFDTAVFDHQLVAREFFVYDATEDQLFITVNHMKNLSNLYTSDVMEWKFAMSLKRILYHNPDTDISTKWLRETVKHRFVDLHKVKAMRGVYIATQLTPGSVGSRHLKSLITYDKGGKWQYIRAPSVNKDGKPLGCTYPFCSLHVNLKFGSVYRYSPTEEIVSRSSAPGILLASAVSNTNLKINPDSYMSTDGGVTWRQIFRGKHHFLICNYGGLLVTTPFNRATTSISYSWDMGRTWKEYKFSNESVHVNELLTEPGEHTAVVNLYGTYLSSNKKYWLGVHINFTKFLGPKCGSKDFTWWSPSDGRDAEMCFLGRVEKFQRRWYNVTCFSDHVDTTPSFQGICECSREDFMCDFGYVPSTYDSGCVIEKESDNHRLSQVPESCSAGDFYYKSRGYRKIPNDPCIGGLENDFLPYKVPCPTESLKGVELVIVQVRNKDIYTVESGGTVQFSVKFSNQPNMTGVGFSWDFGDKCKIERGDGNLYKDRAHTYEKAGYYTVVMTVNNQMSFITKTADIVVQDSLKDLNLTILASPNTILANENSFLVALLKPHNIGLGHLTYNWTIENKVYSRTTADLMFVFPEIKKYMVKLVVSNYVSSITATKEIAVAKDFMPTNVVLVANSPNSLDVTWRPPVEPPNLVKGYQISYMEDGSTAYKSATVEQGVRKYTIENLKAFTTYWVKVATITAVAVGKASRPQSKKTLEDVPGSPPVDVVAKSTRTSSQINLSWKKPNGSINGVLQGYEIQYWKADTSDTPQTVPINNPNVLRKMFVNLDVYTRYVFQIAARTSKGNGPLSQRVFATTSAGRPQLAPTPLATFSVNGTCQFASWEAPDISLKDNRDFPVKDYQLTVNPGNRPFTTKKSQFTICGLKPYTNYTLSITPTSAEGPGTLPLKMSFTTKPTTPGAPQELHASDKDVTKNSVILSWKPPKKINGKLDAYLVRQIIPVPSGTQPWKIPAAANPPYTNKIYRINNLRPYTNYTFEVTAKNVGQTEGESARISLRTKEDTPGRLLSVSVELLQSLRYSAAVLNWNPPENPNGRITKYSISWAADEPKALRYYTDVDGSITSYTVKYLKPQTSYSFTVKASTIVGPGLEPTRKTATLTATAPKGTKRYKLGPFKGTTLSVVKDTMEQWQFVTAFVEMVFGDKSDRAAGVIANPADDYTVQFDITGSFSGPSVADIAKSIKQYTTISVNGLKASGNSLQEVKIEDATPQARVGIPDDGSKGADSTVIVIGIILAIAVLCLLFVAAFYYRKFKALDGSYGQFSGQYHKETDGVHIDANGFDDDDSASDLRIVQPPQMHQPFKKRRKDKKSADDMKPLSENIMLEEDEHILA